MLEKEYMKLLDVYHTGCIALSFVLVAMVVGLIWLIAEDIKDRRK